jgi:DNA-directed RNA polymerase specialized sigma24 family protein
MRIVDRDRRLRSIATRRSLLPLPAERDSPRFERGWTELFQRYGPAMVRYVRSVLSQTRGRRAADEEAEDVVQEYLRQAMEKGWLARDAAEVRCFRAYLQTQLRRFVYKHLEHEGAQRRSPKALVPSALLEEVGTSRDDPAARELDRSWVEVAVDDALERLRVGNADYYQIVADLLRTEGAGSPDLGALLGRSPAQLTHLRHRARRRFSVLLHECLRETVRDDAAFEDLCARLEAYLP